MRGKKCLFTTNFFVLHSKKNQVRKQAFVCYEVFECTFFKGRNIFFPSHFCHNDICAQRSQGKKGRKTMTMGIFLGYFSSPGQTTQLASLKYHSFSTTLILQRKLLIILSQKPIGKPWLCKQRADLDLLGLSNSDFLYNVEKNLIRFQNLL